MQIRLLAVATGALMLGTACGDGGGTPPPDNSAPVAGFSEVCTQLSCVFTDASTDPDGDATITGWSWNFDDNSTANVKAPPVHVYAAEGTYTVELTVTDAAGATDVFSKDVVVIAAANTPPTADFTYACSNLNCSFTDASSDADVGSSIATWSWNFGDAGTSETRNPNHPYLAAGTYDVRLDVTDDRGAPATQTKQVIVTSTPGGNVGPVAEFFPSCIGFTCTFDDQSTDLDGTIASRSWNFGDGSPVSTEENPTHTFASAKAYNVALTVTDNVGATASHSETVTIADPVPVTLNLPARSRLTFTLSARDCTTPKSAFMITAPVADTLFKDGCRDPDAAQLPFAYSPRGPFEGDVKVQFVSGSTHQETKPTVKVAGGYPDWTLTFDDGEDTPADMDLEVKVHASAP